MTKEEIYEWLGQEERGFIFAAYCPYADEPNEYELIPMSPDSVVSLMNGFANSYTFSASLDDDNDLVFGVAT